MEKSKTNQGQWRQTVRYHLPALVFAGAIIAISSIPGPKTPELPEWPIDKLAHFLEYAVFALLLHRSFGRLLNRLSVNIIRGITLLILSGFALMDEFYQSFIPGRQQDPADFAADALGGLTMLITIWFRKRNS